MHPHKFSRQCYGRANLYDRKHQYLVKCAPMDRLKAFKDSLLQIPVALNILHGRSKITKIARPYVFAALNSIYVWALNCYAYQIICITTDTDIDASPQFQTCWGKRLH